MDDETATVILSIQLSDVEEAIQNQKGKGVTPEYLAAVKSVGAHLASRTPLPLLPSSLIT
jgi:hypothetical protein